MIREAFEYPRESDDVVRTVLIGGICVLFSVLVIPAMVVIGYILRVVEQTASGDDDPPAFDDWEELLVEGAKGFLITLAYGIVPVVVIVATVALAALGGFGGETTAALGGAIFVFGMLVAFVLNIAVAYVIPAALANYAESRTLESGFDFDTLRDVLFEREYAVGWLSALVLVLAGAVISGLLSAIPVIGTVIGAFITFYFVVAAYYVIGQTWEAVRGPERPEGRPSGGGAKA